jgi:hypothetical protein
MHFPPLLKRNIQDSQECIRVIWQLREESDTIFQEFKKNNLSFNLFSSPLSTSTCEAPEELQMECDAFQHVSDLKNKFNNSSLFDFYDSCIS